MFVSKQIIGEPIEAFIMSNVIQLFPNAEVKQDQGFLSEEERLIAQELNAEDELVDYLLWTLSNDEPVNAGSEDPISIFRSRNVRTDVA